ncbi:hypothetical protein [Haloarchaeobius sp. HME9146]|uniref:hypothetical protein n=1 Tax=Haloarchaeobius sp. HME9146 TaxID=2978732 RepID=UPI0021C14203|nr:hypothetical protein [Haloarchaeobius sp. HME9146]MCT9094748.1 hypothetical protein [Haloarchaeobius sp. HME9146]
MARETHRRWVLRSLALGAGVTLAGCNTSQQTETEPGTETDTQEPGTDTGTQTQTDEDRAGIVEDLTYLPVRDAASPDELVQTRKEAALKQLFAVDEVATLVEDAVSSTAYHRIFEDVDFVEILAPHEMDVQGSLESGHTIEYRDIKQVRGLVHRETDDLLAVDVRTREPHTIEQNYDSMNMATVEAAMENDQIQQALEGKDWFVAASDYSIITAYSEEFPIGVVTPVLFNWNNDEGDLVAISAAVTTGETNEVLSVQRPTRETTTPLPRLVADARGNDPGEYAEAEIDPPGDMEHEDWAINRPAQTIEQDGWTVEWENTLHDAYRVMASYNGKPVFGSETKVPWMFSDYEPFGLQAPGVPEGQANWHFWDTLGFTGPGVIEKHDFDGGFRIRGSYHTGSLDHWEWRFGQNWGPYRYLIDWNFHDDGVVTVTSRHPTTGFRTTNGYPKYTFHLCIEPGYEAATMATSDGSEWSAVTEETRVDRGDVAAFRVERQDGPERLVFERPGDRNYLLQYDPELVEYDQTLQGVVKEMLEHQEYLDPENYLRGNSVEGEKPLVRLYSSRDTGAGLHATTNPFMFRFRMRAENY